MRAEEMVQKYTQLKAEDKQQVEELLWKLAAKNVDQTEGKKVVVWYMERQNKNGSGS